MGCCPWGHKELDTTEQLTLNQEPLGCRSAKQGTPEVTQTRQFQSCSYLTPLGSASVRLDAGDNEHGLFHSLCHVKTAFLPWREDGMAVRESPPSLPSCPLLEIGPGMI